MHRQHTVHPAQVNADASLQRCNMAFQRRSGTERNDRNAAPGAGTNGTGHFVRGLAEHDNIRPSALVVRLVAAVLIKNRGHRGHTFAQKALEFVDDAGLRREPAPGNPCDLRHGWGPLDECALILAHPDAPGRRANLSPGQVDWQFPRQPTLTGGGFWQSAVQCQNVPSALHTAWSRCHDPESARRTWTRAPVGSGCWRWWRSERSCTCWYP